ncbi:MAG: PBP1A family penicillin-binding protein [Anaerolineae bacterium]|nr:PBP1A family penicillin-binding protein [Anaerolineae bacterium]
MTQSRSRNGRYQYRRVPAPASEPEKRGISGWGCALLVILIAVTVFVLGFMATITGYAAIASTLPSPDELQSRAASFKSTQILARDGTPLNEVFDPSAGRRTLVSFADISPYLAQATIATEDANFYTHPGVDPVSLLRALYYDLRAGEIVMGGSTIPQQLVKLVFLSPEQTLQRKVREAFLAAEITRRYPREKILEMYLNEICYGNLACGAEAAAQTYFGIPAKDLTLAQAALLAGLPQAPAYYDPYRNWEAAKARQQVVLGLMVKQGYITAGEANTAWAEPITLTPPRVEMRAPHFVQYVREELEREFGPQMLYRGGLRVTTTLDPALQAVAEEAARKQVAKLKENNGHNAAVVALKPENGEILAMVGSVDFHDVAIAGQINMAARPRQPGSALKPFTYLAAFERSQEWWTPATAIMDVRTEFPDGANPPFIPKNFDEKEHGLVTVRTALANSYNIPAVKALQHVGLPALLDMARRMGITTLTRPDYGLSLTLGGGEVTLLELTGAYATLANGGVRVPPVAILRIEDAQGNPVAGRPPVRGMRAADQRTVYLITSILADNEARAPMFGRNSVLRLARPAAAKTGTTDDYRDNWTLGYTPDLAVGVWVGNADYKPMRKMSGVVGAGPIWKEVMEAGLKDVPARDFPIPPGLVQIEICTEGGMQPGEFCPARRPEIFAEGRGPLGPEHDIHRRLRLFRVGDREFLAPDGCPDALAEERLFTVYPPEGREWAAKHNIPQPPTEVANGCSAPQVALLQPVEGEAVAGIVSIVGKADAPEFDRYVVEYGEGPDPIGWGFVAEGRERRLEPGLLAQWDTAGLFNMAHTLRVVAYDRRGNAYPSAPVHVVVQNATPEPSPSPSATPTFLIMATATHTPTLTPTLLPSPTATQEKPSPTATVAQATATPQPSPTAPASPSPTPQETPILPSTPTSVPTTEPTATPAPTATLPAQAQGLRAEISQPEEGAMVPGQVDIVGEATGSDFAGYRLDFGLGTNPVDWLPIVQSTTPVDRGVLAQWDTANLGQGRYTLRLVVFGQDDTAVIVVRRVRLGR